MLTNKALNNTTFFFMLLLANNLQAQDDLHLKLRRLDILQQDQQHILALNKILDGYTIHDPEWQKMQRKKENKRLAAKCTEVSLIGVGICCIIYICFVMFDDFVKSLLRPKKTKSFNDKSKKTKKLA